MHARHLAVALLFAALAACASMPPHATTVEHDHYLVTARATRLDAASFSVDVLVDALAEDAAPARLASMKVTLSANKDVEASSESQHDASAVHASVRVDDHGEGARATLHVRVVSPDGAETRVPAIVLGVDG